MAKVRLSVGFLHSGSSYVWGGLELPQEVPCCFQTLGYAPTYQDVSLGLRKWHQDIPEQLERHCSNASPPPRAWHPTLHGQAYGKRQDAMCMLDQQALGCT